MRILFVSSEISPFAKVGGLADVASSLPAALRNAGHDVLSVMPRYRQVDVGAHGLAPHPSFPGPGLVLGPHAVSWSALHHAPTNTFFVDIPRLYDRESIYTDAPDEHLRFAALSSAALEVCRVLRWRPDVIHTNDWQTGLIPALARGPYQADPWVGGVPTVFTIHNLGYQGRFPPSVAVETGMFGHLHLLHDGRTHEDLSFLELAIVHADRLTTVSPTYAREIQTPEGGAGLDGLLRTRSTDLVGILNGIDESEWNPGTDALIPWHYTATSLGEKERNKQALLERLGLPYRTGVPVIGIVARLVWQKGIEIMGGPLAHFLATWDLRLTVLGSGESRYEDLFRDLARAYPDKVSFSRGYDNGLAHLIEAGSDIFLMPSLYEPCGLNQMYSLAYGTPPVVRRVGGLADTVTHFDAAVGTGTGFVFDHYTEDGLGWALGQALALHIDRRSWEILQRNGMAEDNTWRRRAQEYESLYRESIGSATGGARGRPGGRALERRRGGDPPVGGTGRPDVEHQERDEDHDRGDDQDQRAQSNRPQVSRRRHDRPEG